MHLTLTIAICLLASVVQGAVTITGSTSSVRVSAVNSSYAQLDIQGLTSEWVAFGIGSSMSSGDIIVAWASGGTVVVSRRSSTGRFLPAYLATQNLQVVTSSVSGTNFIVTVQRPLASLQAQEKTLVNGTQSYIYATGNTPATTTASASIPQHSVTGRNVLQIDLFPDGSAIPVSVDNSSLDYDALIKAHGCLMFIAWAVWCPLMIVIARNFKPFLGIWWFRLHSIIAIVVVIFVFAAFALGHYANTVSTSAKSAHAVIGIIVLVACGLQFILGVMINALFNPQRSKIPWHDILHHWLGRLTCLLALVNIWLGLVLYSNSSSLNVGFYIAYGIWLGLVVLAIILIQVKHPVAHHLEGKIG
ncbi:hypothetical protein SeMB42_g01789 [Synchytrium endobioticum]|uniref:Cytochrome b561 domain-containing protein n=1 Tax=Synchytrium endobioticum TaxID=286115 RepID=A0A507DJT4_9FUNG|nr:hypothetical protein SeLEV6574_g02511 [Synchytrium endobioticum]TPX51904.1 hypothetical protein SeMB42_g01789 [Synchytrium endobioticum]